MRASEEEWPQQGGEDVMVSGGKGLLGTPRVLPAGAQVLLMAVPGQYPGCCPCSGVDFRNVRGDTESCSDSPMVGV